MRCPETIADEPGRLSALAEYALKADISVPSLNPIVDIAVKLFDVPVAAVNMIGSDHVFFAASSGIGVCDMRRDVSFCAHAITRDEVMVVEDAELDPRFYDNPLVTAGQIRFYAGVPIKAQSGHALGALCIIDSKPHPVFGEPDRARLKELAQLVSDKLERRRLELAIKVGTSRIERRAAVSPQAFICVDRECRITSWNSAATSLFGYHPEEVHLRKMDMLGQEEKRAEIRRIVEAMHEKEGVATGEISAFMALRKDGTCFPAEFVWSQWLERGNIQFGAFVNDRTNCRSLEDTLYHLKNYDSLTNLPNRNLLYSQTTAALKNGAAAAMMIVDLDGLKEVNGTLGHATGDAVLSAIAQRLLQCVGGWGTACRIGGDEFAILLPDVADPLRVNALAGKLLIAVGQPILANGHEVHIAASCGMAIGPAHGDTAECLIGSADLALRQAKTGRPGRSVLFIPALRSEVAARRLFEGELHRAVERGELLLHYQPQVRLTDKALVGAEALLRWRHPVRHLLQPAAFLPALERSTLAGEVGGWILDAACAQAAEWRHTHPEFRISVNLFSEQFVSQDLPTKVAKALSRHSLAPEALELEITENIALDHEALVLPQLRELRKFGVQLAFDDFGTGYASLNLLKSYPINHIKIDKGFTRALLVSGGDRAIVTSLVDLSHRLGHKVIAEGIENAEQLAFLRKHGCEEGQGYLFGEPVPADLFAEKFGLSHFADTKRA